METIVQVLEGIRLESPAAYESEVVCAVARALADAELLYMREVVLGPRCRIDFMVGDVGIEVKKGKVVTTALVAQAERYLAHARVKGLVVVIERSVFAMPRWVNGKPVSVVALNKLWGIAL